MPRDARPYVANHHDNSLARLAVYQARQDARYRLLPYPATFLATLAGLIAIARIHGYGILEITILWHLIGSVLLIIAGSGALVVWHLGNG